MSETTKKTDAPAFDLVNLLDERGKQISAMFEALMLTKDEFDNVHDYCWGAQAFVKSTFEELSALANVLWQGERLSQRQAGER